HEQDGAVARNENVAFANFIRIENIVPRALDRKVVINAEQARPPKSIFERDHSGHFEPIFPRESAKEEFRAELIKSVADQIIDVGNYHHMTADFDKLHAILHGDRNVEHMLE